MRLFIAEKPSMGREIAACLKGPHKRTKDYIETGEGVVIWAYGHILTQFEPGEYDERYQRWNATDLPMVPSEWKLKVSSGAKAQFNRIAKLLKQATEIVHAGDPDREGQLLIDEILTYVGNDKPVKRILLQALDEKSIRDALADLRDNQDFRPLRDSALARSRADWLMGMNLSRAYTLRARRNGAGRVVFPVGRVKTPTLALVVRREREIEHFVPTDYFIVKARFAAEAGIVETKWKPREEQVGLDSEGRLIQRYVGEDLLNRLAANPEGRVSALSKTKKKEAPPLPLSLSALQILAGKRYGYSPDTVLKTAQALYERKWTTYPRSDCAYLPKSQLGDVGAILGHLQHSGNRYLSPMVAGADQSLVSRAWNDKKITAHHAIIPTTVAVPMGALTDVQRHIYELIAQAYIAQFYPNYQYEQTKLEITGVDELFTASGRVEIDAGWKVLYRAESKADDKDTESDDVSGMLPPLKKGEQVNYQDGELQEKQTKPPTRFTASTLLEAMKGIHRYVRNEELKKQLRDVSGIGTEATRATIISDLIGRKFMKETGKKKYLVPTDSAYLLIDSLPETLTYPDETAKWEERLALMSDGAYTLDAFLMEQTEYVTALVAMANDNLGRRSEPTPQASVTRRVQSAPNQRGYERRTSQPSTVGTPATKPCPKCQKNLVHRNGKFGAFWGCTGFPNCRYTENIKAGK